jgi:hypothetical protein
MGSRAREVLLLLVERAGEIVHKRELIAPLHCGLHADHRQADKNLARSCRE